MTKTPKKYNLADFGMNKASLKRNMENSGYYDEVLHDISQGKPFDGNTESGYKIIALMAKRTTFYTLEELLELSNLMSTSNHDCANENEDDFLPIVVAQARRILDKQAEVRKTLEGLINDAKHEPIAEGYAYVKMNEHYTATVRNIEAFKTLLNNEKIIDLSLLKIVSIGDGTPEEFTNEIQTIIDKYYSLNLK
jgi:hypothetical protein